MEVSIGEITESTCRIALDELRAETYKRASDELKL
jgi:hypothetical protein